MTRLALRRIMQSDRGLFRVDVGMGIQLVVKTTKIFAIWRNSLSCTSKIRNRRHFPVYIEVIITKYYIHKGAINKIQIDRNGN